MSTPPISPSPPADTFWAVVEPPVDAGFWGPQSIAASGWTVQTPPVDSGYWTPTVGKQLDINFILDESRLS